ncbi:phage shock protein A (PspA) family protein [Hypnocyclicus thermotrophus]|uniref:Phage shock protein A (PspA) family protein n=1 Tax=Hypnocyclicus thermotrophus TaxID=1627895 RepID=A0AA46E097_9FUSO|nr:PspA/IM30 family protein [Hypnocyclicus thermotrophus]TDT72302.1 phage shock protein A (PspA) family protein [Hypnocyclicus thermotrophus]
MGIFDRLGKVFKSNVNSIIDKMEDPEKILEQNILDMEKEYTKAKQAIASTKAEEIRLTKQIKFLEQEINKWVNNAKAALNAGNEELAKKALEKKQALTKELEQIKNDRNSISTSTEKLISDLKMMENKIEEAKRKKDLLKSRIQSAKAKKKINELKSTTSTIGKSAFDSFSKMEEKANKIINEADAIEEINKELTGEDLEAQFESLNGNSDVDDELAKLKSELNK